MSGKGRYFGVRPDEGGHHGFRVKVSEDDIPEGLIDHCCEGMAREKRTFQEVGSSRFARVYTFAFSGRSYFLKEFLPRGSLERLKSLFRGTRAEREARGHLVLREYGFRSPRPVMMARRGPVSFLLCGEVQNGRGWREYYKGSFRPPCSKDVSRRKIRDISGLGAVIGRMHAEGIVHGDLRWGNILIDVSETGGPRFCFLDNERTMRTKSPFRRKRMKNLVQVNMAPYDSVTRADRMRFFNAYLRENPQWMNRKKAWAGLVSKRTRKRLERGVRKMRQEAS